MMKTQMKYLLVSLLFLAALGACQPVGFQATPTTGQQVVAPKQQTASTTPAAIPPSSPTPAGSPVAMQTETSAPTITPPVPPTPIPATWKTFTSPALNVTLRYPDNWKIETAAQKATRASGPDGFFEISTRTYPA